MGIKVSNNAYGVLAAGITATDTTISVGSGEGARFPSLGGSDYFYMTLVDTANNIEIVKVTARATDTMTVVRGQDGTTAKVYPINSRVELRPCAALFDNKADLAYVDTVVATKMPYVAPGTAGNILKSNGTAWVSEAPAGGGVTSLNGQTGAITNTDLYAIGSYVIGRPQNLTVYAVNSTLAGSSLYATSAGAVWISSAWQTINGGFTVTGISVLINTGTWRCVAPAGFNNSNNQGLPGLWVRIS